MAESEQSWGKQQLARLKDPTERAFFWLTAFYVVYCARPEDWIPGLNILPLAKITGILCLWGLYNSLGRTKRTTKDIPIEGRYLMLMIGLLFISGFLSPVWRGGAVLRTLDFAKSYVAWLMTFLLVTTFERLRRLMYIQSACVAVVCTISIIKGHSLPRLEGVLGGIYSNPNDLAFAIVLMLPFCFAFLLTSKSVPRKIVWLIAMLIMSVAIFMTASRAGFIDLVIAGSVTMWHFAVKGKRPYLFVIVAVLGTLLMTVAGGKLKERFAAISGDNVSAEDRGALGSYEQRRYLMIKAIECIERYPILGIGANNITTYAGVWHEVHMTYLQIAAEGGIPSFILFMLFFARGFSNLRQLSRMKDLDPEKKLFIGALHSSLIGFVVGALFAPEAYEFFPYFAVAYTSTLLQIIKEQGVALASVPTKRQRHYLDLYDDYPKPAALPVP